MGKNKSQRGKQVFKKDPVATKVAGVKKTKTKAVVTNLKKMTFRTRSRTENVDAEFAQLQSPTESGRKKPPSSPYNTHTQDSVDSGSSKATQIQEEPDVDMTVEELSKLSS
ncbi:hypothetical protein V1264_000008 [Littorina saxatilis]|uniref:Uncharacterized protein n=1 Tax=Littorina saxatilis TaxID=31220 RepID=A0AAN9BZ75_9CAEN